MTEKVEETIIESSDQAIMISGESGTGKSMSLRNLGKKYLGDGEYEPDLTNQKRWMYLNCEAGKKLPFRNNFDTYKITDPWQVHQGVEYAGTSGKHDGVVIDTLTFLMEMFESKYIYGLADGRAAWNHFQQYFKKLMQEKVPLSGLPIIFLAHTADNLDEKKMEIKTAVPIKGALKSNGIEAYFSTVVSTKKISINELSKYGSKLLHYTDLEKELGYKHVFQTTPTKETIGDRIRAPWEMFDRSETYIDNDAAMLLHRLNEYYK